MPLNIPANVRSLAANLNARLQAAAVDQGQGNVGDYPANGDHVCDLTGMDVNFDAKFDFTPDPRKSKERETRKGYSLRFKFCKQDDPAGPKNFSTPNNLIVPYDKEKLPSNQLQRVEIAEGRVNGFLTPLLGAKPTDIFEALETVNAMIEAAAAAKTTIRVVVRTKIDKDVKGNDGKLRDQYEAHIQEMRDGAVSDTSADPSPEEVPAES